MAGLAVAAGAVLLEMTSRTTCTVVEALYCRLVAVTVLLLPGPDKARSLAGACYGLLWLLIFDT